MIGETMTRLHNMVVERIVTRLNNDGANLLRIEDYAEDRLEALADWLADKAFELYKGGGE